MGNSRSKREDSKYDDEDLSYEEDENALQYLELHLTRLIAYAESADPEIMTMTTTAGEMVFEFWPEVSNHGGQRRQQWLGRVDGPVRAAAPFIRMRAPGQWRACRGRPSAREAERGGG